MIHLVYPTNPSRIAAPWSIGNHLATGLRAAGHEVRLYDWAQSGAIRPTGPSDVLIGHPHPEPGRVFTSSLRAGWSRTVAVTPWGGLPLTERMVDEVLPYVDAVALICGPYWAERVPRRWRAKAACLDMAIDRVDYPRLKPGFNAPGKRRVLYVGCAGPAKGTDYLERVISRGVAVDHAGFGSVAGARSLGYANFASAQGQALVDQYDLLVACGKNDANPTTILEAGSWGLIALATPTCGWGEDVAVHLSADDPGAAASLLHWWLDAPESFLLARRAEVDKALGRYTWQRFVARVLRLL